MCGIFGFARLDEKARLMAPHLAYAMETRGKDAWGATNGEDSESGIVKFIGPICASFVVPDEWERGIFHTRNGTSGKNDLANAHPHRTGHIVGIHNGIISNDDELNKQYGRGFSCDSQHIFAHLAEFKPLGELHGYAACAWFNNKDEYPYIYIWQSNNASLYIATMEDGNIVFCSEDTPIIKAAGLACSKIEGFYTVDDGTIYRIKPTDTGFGLFEVQVGITLGARFTYDHRTSGRNQSCIWGNYGDDSAPWMDGQDWDGYTGGSSSSFNSNHISDGGDTAGTGKCLFSHRGCMTHNLPPDMVICEACLKDEIKFANQLAESVLAGGMLQRYQTFVGVEIVNGKAKKVGTTA